MLASAASWSAMSARGGVSTTGWSGRVHKSGTEGADLGHPQLEKELRATGKPVLPGVDVRKRYRPPGYALADNDQG